jgi:hypothetical protein
MEAETEMGRVAALVDVIDATGRDLRVPGLVKIWLQLSSSMARLLGAGEAERDERRESAGLRRKSKSLKVTDERYFRLVFFFFFF